MALTDPEKSMKAISMEQNSEHQEAKVGADVALTDVSYDNKGISGIVRSPYVFGAALLASFGGFSFGYDQVWDQFAVFDEEG